jgi:selenocysteine-specific elongation factor
MRVIGTAGHVDHGKSTLVKALTGTDPDRLKEEKIRQMTIDLGFAFFNSPEGEPIGIIDVPGHRDFIENMLAGVGGIDAVLFVIAADEGVMPQSREHMAILDLMGVKRGIVVLTKADLITDPDWFDLIENELMVLFRGTVLENAKIMRVSSVTGAGISELKKEINVMLATVPQHQDLGLPRLPVDRVFSIQGFGTVVTGTLTGGCFKTGDQIEILVSKKKGRIRGLQSHNQQETIAFPGSRTAVNISGIEVGEVARGDVVSLQGVFQPTLRIDAKVLLLPDSPTKLSHNDYVKFFTSASVRIARVRVLGKDAILPGDSGWVQIEFDQAVIAEKNDKFILRRISPADTIGGGFVINSTPGLRYKRNDPIVLERFEARESTALTDDITNLIVDSGFIDKQRIVNSFKGSEKQIEQELDVLLNKKQIISLEGKHEGYYSTKAHLEGLLHKIFLVLTETHNRFPLRPGLTCEEIENRLKLDHQICLDCLKYWVAEGLIEKWNKYYFQPDFKITYSPQQTRKLEAWDEVMQKDRFSPPDLTVIKSQLGADLYQSLVDQGKLIPINPEIAYREQEYLSMMDFAISECQVNKLLTISYFRDHFSTTRKYSLAFLEHLDWKGITIREGEGRRLKEGWEKIVDDLHIH